jgi:hypothetical protein
MQKIFQIGLFGGETAFWGREEMLRVLCAKKRPFLLFLEGPEGKTVPRFREDKF